MSVTDVFDSYALEAASKWTTSQMGLYREARGLAYKEEQASKKAEAEKALLELLHEAKGSLQKL